MNNQTKENKITTFTMHVHSNMRHLIRVPTRGERIHAVNKAFEMLHTAVNANDPVSLYEASTHLAAVAGKVAMHDGDETAATKRAIERQKCRETDSE